MFTRKVIRIFCFRYENAAVTIFELSLRQLPGTHLVLVPLVVDGSEDEDVEDEKRGPDGDSHTVEIKISTKVISGPKKVC